MRRAAALAAAVLLMLLAAVSAGANGTIISWEPGPDPTPLPAGTPDPDDDPLLPPTPVPTATPAPTPTPAPTATPVPEPRPDRELLRVHQIDIGYGDAYLLTIGDLVILVDCGTNTYGPISDGHHNYPLFEYLEATGIDHVDIHFVTHWHNDHDYNVNQLGALYGTEDTIVYGPSPRLYRELDPLVAGTYRQLKDGDRLSVGGLDILCVGPAERDEIPGDRNIDSLNFIVTYGDIRIMFTGDFILSTIASRWPQEITNLDVLSFPHHGSVIQETPVRPYRMMNPRLVLITSNELGVVRQYALYSAGVTQDAVYLSYRHGHVLVSTDGDNIWYATDVTPGTTPLGELLPPRTN